MESPVKNLRVQGGTTMARAKLTAEEWDTFLGLADRLGIPVRELLDRKVRFTEMESAGHQLGRAVAQITTERLAYARAERITGPQACPTCGKGSPVTQRERDLTTVDGPLDLIEPVAHCPACRRDFFPSACGIGTGSAELQSAGDRQDRFRQRGA